MYKKYIIATLIASLTWGSTLWAAPKQKETGYKIILTIKNSEDTIMYLGNYYAGKTYASDTARINKKGQFVFDNPKRPTMPGLYFFTNPAGRHVDFVVYNEKPDFSFTTDDRDWTLYMQVKGSKENEMFFAYQKINSLAYETIDSASKVKTDEEAFKAFRTQVLRKLDSTKIDIIEKHPNSFISLMMNATREPDVPIVDEKGDTLDRRARYDYYMDHYFDYMRLDDDAMVRTPDAVFHKRVLDYLDVNLRGADAEILCEYIDKLISRAKPSKEVYKYLVHTISEKYLQSKVMSYDAVYVHMIKEYYENGNYWSSPSTIDANVKRANTWERLLIGKVAPDLILRDNEGNIFQMSQLKHKYTLLVFWSPTCGHCKTVIPALFEKYKQYKERCDIAAFTILSEPDDATTQKWVRFIDEHQMNDPQWLNLHGGEANIDWHEVYNIETTPQIYLLDKDKKILAKKLNQDTFEMVIKAIEGIE